MLILKINNKINLNNEKDRTMKKLATLLAMVIITIQLGGCNRPSKCSKVRTGEVCVDDVNPSEPQTLPFQ